MELMNPITNKTLRHAVPLVALTQVEIQSMINGCVDDLRADPIENVKIRHWGNTIVTVTRLSSTFITIAVSTVIAHSEIIESR
jgi:hypothetical protein